MRALLLLATSCGHALLVPRPIDRRTALTSIGAVASAGPASALPWLPPVSAADKGGVQWSLSVPDGFSVSRQLASIVRIKIETMLAADDSTTGAQIKLLLLPFGQQAAASLDADEQLQLANFFFSSDGQGGAESVAAVMTASAARSPSVLSLQRVGKPEATVAGNGRRYVRYEYSARRCSGEIDGGECFGDIGTRRTMATVTMSSISQYRTNTERQRMAELGQVRNVQVLWLLTISAPEAKFDALRTAFTKASLSFDVPEVAEAAMG